MEDIEKNGADISSGWYFFQIMPALFFLNRYNINAGLYNIYSHIFSCYCNFFVTKDKYPQKYTIIVFLIVY